MSAPPEKKRPRTVTITLWGVFLLGGWQVGRMVALGQTMRMVADFNSSLDPRWRLGAALVWAMVFLGLAWGLWRKRPFTRRAVPIALLFYALYRIILLAFFAQGPAAPGNWLWQLILHVGSVLFSYWALNRPATTAYFTQASSLVGER